MSRPLCLLRPEPGWSGSAAAAQALGLEVVGHPLFVAEPIAWTPPAGRFDALLVGSGATFRHGGEELMRYVDLPVHAVGSATASAATDAGFTVARTGEGGLQGLLNDTAGDTRARYLRLGGEERVELAPHPSQTLVECAVYRMESLQLDCSLVALLQAGTPLVALHSAAAARHFSAEVDRLQIERGRIFVLVLGARIAMAAGLGWASLHISDRPNDAALLAKAAALCK